MTRKPLSCDAGLPFGDAWKRMYLNGVRHLVAEQDGYVVGLLSARRMHQVAATREADFDDLRVRDALVVDPPVISHGDDLTKAAEILESSDWDACLVTDPASNLVGLLSVEDALWALRCTLARPGEQPTRARPRERSAAPRADGRGPRDHIRMRQTTQHAFPRASLGSVLEL